MLAGKKEAHGEGPLCEDKVMCRIPSEAPGGCSEEEEGETPAASLQELPQFGVIISFVL